MTLPIRPPYPPMEARVVDAIPLGGDRQYEPKWDGFRCLAFRDGDSVELQSKAGEPLARYFPEVVEHLLALTPRRFVLDGELVVPSGESLSFDDLLQRIHPAESRIRKLAAETPALLVVFDLLVDDAGRSLVDLPLAERRARLEAFAARFLVKAPGVALSPVTVDPAEARRWLETTRGALDGVIAKERALAYRSGERTGMEKYKPRRSADCVVGGFRDASKGNGVGSLLLGLFDDDGKLHHVGFTSSLPAHERVGLRAKLDALVEPPGFSGRAPGGPSRWNRGRSTDWHPLAPKLVVEVEFDHVSGGRFRHGTRFVRWRPDKSPEQCTIEQIAYAEGRVLDLVAAPVARRSGERPVRTGRGVARRNPPRPHTTRSDRGRTR